MAACRAASQEAVMGHRGEGLSRDAQALLDAVTAMSSDLDLHNVLDGIVASACAITGARYGALGVVGEKGHLTDFVTHGIGDAERAAIGDLPHGRGIIGELIKHPASLRLPRLQDHPASYGFPPNHPPMTTFLGVPVLIRGMVFGNLYLTEKAAGEPFTGQDQRLVEALATAAGFAIENARAYALSERQRAWLETTARLNESLRPGIDVPDALQLVAVATRMVSRARAVGLLYGVASGEGVPVLVASDGRDSHELGGLLEAMAGQVAAASGGTQPDPVSIDGTRIALVLPLRAHLFGSAVMVVILHAEDRELGPGHKELDLVAAFADQAALALDRVQALVDREKLAIVSDRDRIARDLHDLVIQRLFATGLHLQSIRGQVTSPQLLERLDGAVNDLDGTIRDIRSTIFELQHTRHASLRAAVADLVHEYARVLGIQPSLRVRGPIDTLVPPAVAEQMLPVLREGLSNVAKHARASSVVVEVEVDIGEAVLRITDDGVGLGRVGQESGLANVRKRAAALQGAARLTGGSPDGAILEWRAPLATSSPGVRSGG